MVKLFIYLKMSGSFIEIDSELVKVIYKSKEENKCIKLSSILTQLHKLKEFSIAIYITNLLQIGCQIAVWHFEHYNLQMDIGNFGGIGYALKIETPRSNIEEIKQMISSEDVIPREWKSIWRNE